MLFGEQVRDLVAPTHATGSFNQHAPFREEGSHGSVVLQHKRVL